jgi:hypothetical protein
MCHLFGKYLQFAAMRAAPLVGLTFIFTRPMKCVLSAPFVTFARAIAKGTPREDCNMAKKITTTTKTAAPPGAAAKPASALTNIIGEPPALTEPTNGVVATAEATKTARTAQKAKPPTSAPKPKAKPTSTTAGGTKKVGFTQDDVALRAYFIAEKRRTLGVPGDEHTDWIEAERQLKAESKRGSKKSG